MFNEEIMKKIFGDFTDEEMKILDFVTIPLSRDKIISEISLLREDLDEMGPKLLMEGKIKDATSIAETMVWLETFETLLKGFSKIDEYLS